MVKLIVAISSNWVLGDGDELVWHIPEDLKFFKKTTVGHSLLMGSKTYEGLPGSLPNRKTYVLTRDIDKYKNNIHITPIDDAVTLINKYKKSKDNILFISGGKTVYEQYHSFADEIIVTHIYGEYDGDIKWPELRDLLNQMKNRESIMKTDEFEVIKYKK